MNKEIHKNIIKFILSMFLIFTLTGFQYSARKKYLFRYKFKNGRTTKYKMRVKSKQGGQTVEFRMVVPIKVVRINFRGETDIDINIDTMKMNGREMQNSVNASLTIKKDGEVLDTSSSWPGMNLGMIFQKFPKKPISVKHKWTSNLNIRMQGKEVKLRIKTNFKGFRNYRNRRASVFISTFVSEDMPLPYGKMKIIGKRVVYFDRKNGVLIETKARAQMVMYIAKRRGTRIVGYKKQFGPLIYSYFTISK